MEDKELKEILKSLVTKEDLGMVKEDLKEVHSKLDAHSASLMTIERELGYFKEGLDDIKENRKRIKVLEQKAHTHI